MKVNINIDGKDYQVDKDTNVLQAVLSLEKDLPYFCWHPAMHSVGACRQCSIVKYRDEEDKRGRMVMACMEPIMENMRISIEAPQARAFRAGITEALMINHPHDCPVCDEAGECHLQDMTIMTGHTYRRYRFNKRTHNNQYLGPFINHEMNRCIQCYRCVRFYNDYAGGTDFGVFAAHDDVYFGRFEPGVLEDEFSGNLIELCPTGVFTDKTLKGHFTRKWDYSNGPSICHGCSLGCNIIASERYGKLRRIRSRYNGDVNGYFICDRGRFGYEYVNNDERILYPRKTVNDRMEEISRITAIGEIKNIAGQGRKLIGIGSPKASLESNFMLREWVGAENFYAGIPASEGKPVKEILRILKKGSVRTPSLDEVRRYDAVFVLGEDVTNTAPMLALNIRQAAKNKPKEEARSLNIPEWNDAATRNVVQGAKGPVYVAAASVTKLDDIATRSYYAHPDDIARLAYEVRDKTGLYSGERPKDGEPEENPSLAGLIAADLMAAKKPLIVSGASLHSEALIQAASALAESLKKKGKEVGLVYVVPEANTMGLAMLTDQYLEDAYEEDAEAAILLETDLYQRTDRKSTDAFLSRQKHVISLHYLENETTRRSDFVLPTGTFAEADGTVVNNEGRAQRFYRAYLPENEVRSSWEWIQAITGHSSDEVYFDEIIRRMVQEFPELEPVLAVAPDADFRMGTQKIPRSSHRFSGRTSIHADLDVSEPKPALDYNSPLSYTMEGYTGTPPSSVTPFYWTPGWNSVQAINKYQIEVGGELHGGNPGKRLLEPASTPGQDFSENIPEPFSPEQGQYIVLPLYHIYGSEELSSQSKAVMERIPEAYVAMSDADAGREGIREEDRVEINVREDKYRLPVKLGRNIPDGVIGLPKGLRETAGMEFPFSATVKLISDE